jgi:hypothetical protein
MQKCCRLPQFPELARLDYPFLRKQVVRSAAVPETRAPSIQTVRGWLGGLPVRTVSGV